MKRKAIIISIAGKKLTSKEKKLIKKEKPWGVILFKRNIVSLKKTKKLIKNIRFITGDRKYPVMIDEEGGNVCRLSKFLDNRIYSQKFFGDLYSKDKKIGVSLYKNYISSICSVFKTIGVNINTVPVLDLLKVNTHTIIGSRSYSTNKHIVKFLGKICVDSYKLNKIGSVIKHIPGHGRGLSDSHKKLPIVNTNLNVLMKNDFLCFKGVNSYFAMTAHILYKKIDSKNVSTHSKYLIKEIIRKKIGFRGILISDDISMKALKYDLLTNAKKSLNAGCNLVLYCAGKYNESARLLKNLPLIDSFTVKKTSEFYNFLS
jgi:beta-N-acetylhexosaminidase